MSSRGQVLPREATLVGVLALCIYALTQSAVPALTHDSLTYLSAIEQGGPALFHPHHLAYNALARGWLDLARGLGITADPLRVVALLNSVLGAVAAALVWLVLRMRAGLPRSLAAAGTAGAALSFGVWFYSVSVEVYLLPLVLLLATFLAVTGADLSLRRMAVVGALNGLAVLGHQVNVLFAVVVIVAVVHRTDRATALRRVAAYGGVASAVVVGGYASVLSLSVRAGSPAEARSWFTRYAGSDTYWDVGPASPAKAAVGLTRSVVGGQFSFRLDRVRDQMQSAFPDRSLADETFLVRNLPSAAAWLLTAIAATALVLLVVMIARGVRRRAQVPEPGRRVVRLLAVWFAAYAAFFVFWDPVNLEFWIPQATVLWMATVILWAPAEHAVADRRAGLPKGTVGLGLAAGAVAAVNLFGTILPAADVQNDVYALRYSALADLVEEGDVVVVEYPHLGVPYTDRLTDAEAVSYPAFSTTVEMSERDEPSPGELIDSLDEALADGNTVVVDSLLIVRPDSDRSRTLGLELEDHYGDRWRPTEVPGAHGWLVIDG